MLSKIFGKIYGFCLDLLFPIECLGCGKEGEWICAGCWQAIESFPEKKAAGLKIAGCHKILVAVDYRNKLVAKSIHSFKYKTVTDLAVPLAKLIITRFGRRDFPPESIFVPVPLHRARWRERGFNQSERLAQQLARHYNFPVAPNVLIRVKHTKPQMSLKRADRQQNIKQAFRCIAPAAVTGKNVWLIDDVLTTGATISECARALQKSRPRSINAIVLAHSAD